MWSFDRDLGQCQKVTETVIALSPFSFGGITVCDQIKISGGGLVDSYNSANGTYSSQATNGPDAQGHHFAGQNGNVWTLGAISADITISNSGTGVHGNVSATGTVSNAGTIYGTVTNGPAPCTCDPLGVSPM